MLDRPSKSIIELRKLFDFEKLSNHGSVEILNMFKNWWSLNLEYRNIVYYKTNCVLISEILFCLI
jgi:hypothetical protein